MADKIHELHFGKLKGDVNYALMHMFNWNGRYERHLNQIVDEYNDRAEPHHQITLHQMEKDNGGFYPLFIPEHSKIDNSIAWKHANDMFLEDPSVRDWIYRPRM